MLRRLGAGEARWTARLLGRIGLTAALLAGAPAGAADGVLEINQVCAEGPGCFPGDAGGFPVEITLPGSYRLTGGLSLPDADTGAIELATDDVSIDLGGFTIRGVTDCTIACAPTGTGKGIYGASSQLFDRVSVRGGSVEAMGNDGIALGQAALVVDVRVAGNAGLGITVASGTLTRCTATGNGSFGIEIDDSGSLSDSAADQNTYGFHTIGSATVRSVASDNGIVGFFSRLGVVADSSAVSNGTGFLVSGSLARSTARSNTSDGVRSFAATPTISQVTSRANTGDGLTLDAGSGYRGCIVSNNGGVSVSAGLALDGNLCNGSTTCP